MRGYQMKGKRMKRLSVLLALIALLVTAVPVNAAGPAVRLYSLQEAAGTSCYLTANDADLNTSPCGDWDNKASSVGFWLDSGRCVVLYTGYGYSASSWTTYGYLNGTWYNAPYDNAISSLRFGWTKYIDGVRAGCTF